MKITSPLIALALASMASLTPLHAAILFTFDQVGSDVVATTSGSIAGGWTINNLETTSSLTRGVILTYSIRGEVAGGPRFLSAGDHWTLNNTLVGVTTDTSGTLTGDPFGFSTAENFYAPVGTSVGDAFTPNTTITWAGKTLESMGLDTALSTSPLLLFTLDNGDTISAVRAGAAAVPEPGQVAASLLLLAGLGGYALLKRRKQTTPAKA